MLVSEGLLRVRWQLPGGRDCSPAAAAAPPIRLSRNLPTLLLALPLFYFWPVQPAYFPPACTLLITYSCPAFLPTSCRLTFFLGGTSSFPGAPQLTDIIIEVSKFQHWHDVGQSHQVRLAGLLGYKGGIKGKGRAVQGSTGRAVQSVGRNKSDSKNFQQFSAAARTRQRQLIAANSCKSSSRPFIAATSHSSSFRAASNVHLKVAAG